MFGAPAFGAFAFGQVAGLPFTPLAASATITIGVDNTFRQESYFIADLSLTWATAATLALAGQIAAAAGFTFGTTAPISAPAPLKAQSTITFGTDRYLFDPGIFDGSILFDTGSRLTAALTVTGPLYGVSTVSLGTTAPLMVGGHPLAGVATTIPISVSATLRSLPATFTAQAGIRFGVVANVVTKGARATDPVVAFNGALTSAIRLGSLVITDILNEAPNTCDFITDDAPPPAIGTDVKIGLQNFSPANLLFAGTVRRVDRLYELRKQNPSWAISCLDYTWLINRKKVFGTWTNISATTVAQQIVAQFTSGFSTAGIVGGLPTITVTFNGEDVMDALTQIANLVGGYTKVDYQKVVQLFITDPGIPPHPIDGTAPKPMNLPAIVHTQDETQVRTRVYLRGDAVAVVGPSEQAIPAGSGEIPIDDGSIFSSGQVITEDARILSYGGTAPGGQSATVVGNVPGPSSAGVPTLAVGTAGQVAGTVQYKVAFANAAGETTPGPPSAPIFAPTFATPTGGPGIGTAGPGPLIGDYGYRISFLTTLGETTPGPITRRTAAPITVAPAASVGIGPSPISRLQPGTYQWVVTYVTQYGETIAGPPGVVTMANLAPPSAPSVANAFVGVLPVGAAYSYAVTYVSQDGETGGGFGASLTISNLFQPSIVGAGSSGFGGLRGGPYAYGAAIVTREGEASPLSTVGVGSGFFRGGPTTSPSIINWTTGGSIGNGTYYWAASFFHDVWGETALGPNTAGFLVSSALPLQVLLTVPAVPADCTGIRIYRRLNTSAFMLNIEFRLAAGIPGSYWDPLEQGENGSSWPVQALRGGLTHSVQLGASSEPGVVARRVYRTKSGGSEYFLVGEVQNNTPGWIFVDNTPDESLTVRNPATGSVGRTVNLTIPTGPAGTIARRIYRTKAGGSAYYLIGELKDNSSAAWTDNAADTALTVSMPLVNTAGSGLLGGSGGSNGGQPRVTVPIGPAGVIARRVYRTKRGGGAYFRVTEIPNNTVSFYDDNIPDDSLGSDTIPAATTAGGESHLLSSLPIGPAGTLARKIYRTKPGGTEVFYVGQVSDNATATFTDSVPDSALGEQAPLTNTAGASAILLTVVPTGSASVTQRIIFRAVVGSNDFRYVGTVDDNTSTTYLDTRATDSLGRPPQVSSTIGALAGDGFLTLDTTAGWPTSGWIHADHQYVRYTGITVSPIGGTLTGIPVSRKVLTITRSGTTATMTTNVPHGFATGDRITVSGADQTAYNGVKLLTSASGSTATFEVLGSPVTPATPGNALFATPLGGILAPIPGRTVVETVAMLTSVSAMSTPVLVGERLALWVTVNSAAGQAALAATEGGDGVHEYVITDATLRSVDACTKRGLAELKLFEFVGLELSYTTRDPLTRSGPMIHVGAGAAAGFTGDFRIQQVRIDEIGVWVRTYPRYTVTASNTKQSLADILRHVVLDSV